ncbi:RUS family member 1 [Ambystoma mexicanum]|uniref:RUS family member 1 n=1 Tax=Ambystoma mexicanum TaxID=8296 RepID=UPI0037E95D23
MEFGDDLDLVCTERYGSRRMQGYVEDPDGRLRCVEERVDGSYRSLRDFFTSVFLPQGYPESVSDDYLTYQIWDTIQAFASSVTGTLATQAMLRGVGVGDETATVTAATLTWILKDGTGMLGRIFFAWMKGSKLDCDAKKWRLFADVLNDLAIFMEILAPAFPTCFTIVVCIAGLCKCIVGVAGGATRAALTMHQARRDNMADVSAKDGSQETLVNLAGLLVSLLLIPLVTDNLQLVYFLFFVFTSLHLYANFRAVRGIVMDTLNQSRLAILVQHFLRDGWVLTPSAANPEEPLFPVFQRRLTVNLGAPLHMLVTRKSDLEKAQEGNMKNYLLTWNRSSEAVCVAMHEVAGSLDMIQACVHVEILNVLLHKDVGQYRMQASTLRTLQKRASEVPHHRVWETVMETHQLVDQIFPEFLKGLIASGWVTDRHLLDFDEWRADWHLLGKKSE